MSRSLVMWPATRLRFDGSRSLVRDCQEDVEIGKFHNSILPTDRNYPWGENSYDTNICHLQFTLVHCLMDSFSSHTLVQLLYNLHLQDVERSELNDPINSHHITSIRLSITRNNDHTNLGAWFLACSSSSPVPNTMSVVSWSLWPGSMLSLRDSCVDVVPC